MMAERFTLSGTAGPVSIQPKRNSAGSDCVAQLQHFASKSPQFPLPKTTFMARRNHRESNKINI
jgi:hypothetical protein